MIINFLNVGKGNCTVIDFPSEHLTIVDIDNSRGTNDNELTDPVDFLKKRYKGRNVFRFILTHPDMDHLSGLHELHTEFDIINFWDTDHDKTLEFNSDDKSPYKKEDWETYLRLRKSDLTPKSLQNLRHESKDHWNTDKVTILSPSKKLIKLSKETPEGNSNKHNHLSYVLRIDCHGKRILLGGDATIDAWDDILEECGKEALKADIFLAPHHGSKNNVNEEVFKHIAPDFVIVSVAEGVDYDYDYYSKLAQKEVLSTKYYGNISFELKEDKTYEISVQKNYDK